MRRITRAAKRIITQSLAIAGQLATHKAAAGVCERRSALGPVCFEPFCVAASPTSIFGPLIKSGGFLGSSREVT
jgi:hypothetical protein